MAAERLLSRGQNPRIEASANPAWLKGRAKPTTPEGCYAHDFGLTLAMGALAIPAAAFTDPGLRAGQQQQGAERWRGQVPSARPDLDRARLQVAG
jgi:hypothetical protein